MSKAEILACLEEIKQYPILPYPGMVFANEEDVVSMFYDDYTIAFYFRTDMAIIEITA
jgi:hypothetical protein